MHAIIKRLSASIVLCSPLFISTVNALDFSGRAGLESRFFIDDNQLQNSVLVEPEFYWASKSNNDTFTLKVFSRYDDLDDERSHIDIREAAWMHVGDTWEVKTGLSKVYWGVTESNHLVDIINQTDSVESADGEQKLGQPMVQLTSIRDWGVVDAFILPGFRERTFPGENGRLQGPVLIDTDNAQYEHEDEDQHIDYALRYSHTLSIFDFSLSGFKGTSRDAEFRAIDTNNALPTLSPYYAQIEQLGLATQAIVGDWLLKLEAIQRKSSEYDFSAYTAGFEYTFNGIFNSNIDLGILSEYNKDSRDQASPSPLNNDLFVGTRLAFNDVQSTDLLIGVSQDLSLSNSYLGFIEGSRRVGDNFKATIDVRLFNGEYNNDNLSNIDPLLQIEADTYGSFSLEYFY